MMTGFLGQPWTMTPLGEMFPEGDALHRCSSPRAALKTAVELFCMAAEKAGIDGAAQPLIVCTARDVAELAQDYISSSRVPREPN